MARRGRPPYPDVLTPREFEVLTLLREGLSNEEVAQQLGISLAGAKYHVSEILGKLGVASREEAAAWRSERPWWTAAFAPIAWSRRLGWPQAAALVAAIAVAAGIGVLVWGLVRTSGDGGAAPALSAPIVLGTGPIGGAHWSPDGRSIAYSADGVLYRADAPAFEGRAIARTGGDLLSIGSPRWSPDGERIAFLGGHPGRGGDPAGATTSVWLVQADGSALHDLLPGPAATLAIAGIKTRLGWLNGSTVFFEEHCGTACQWPFLLDVDTSELQHAVVVDNPQTGTDNMGAAGTIYYWSPDRRWLAVENLGQTPSVLLYNVSSHAITPLAAELARPWQWFDSWAPDSSSLVYHQAAASGTSFRGPVSLHLYDVARGEDRLVATQGTDGAWSSDGKRIAFVQEQSAGQFCGDAGAYPSCVVVIDVASGRELYRLPGPGVYSPSSEDKQPLPVFLPDGRLLYLGSQSELRLADGSNSSALVSVGILVDLYVSPDGRLAIIDEPARVQLVPIPAK